MFVHIKSFSNRQRRPTGNELVTYELTSDPRGRPRGVNVAFIGDRLYSPATSSPGPGTLASVFSVVFLAFVTMAVAAGKLPFAVLLAYLLASCFAYLAYFLDKVASVQKQWRKSESALHVLSLVGGWPGAMLAQRTLRHKTQKQSFQATYWATVVLNCAALGWLLSPAGMRTFQLFRGGS